MSFYEDRILPHIINYACGDKAVAAQRQKVVPRARGRILEIGIGTGLNLPHYDAAKVETLIGLDPSERSWKIAGDRARAVPFDVEFVGLEAEEIPLEADSVDTVVVTYSLCTIPDPVRALSGMRRVLKPGGELVFCEHGRAPGGPLLKWQNRVNPVWKRLFGGCHINRDIPALIREGGFRITDMEADFAPDVKPRFIAYEFWGAAEAA